jgi:hypothetical protein
MSGHTEDCWAAPQCGVCGLTKKPVGRDAGLAAANGFCGSDCEGYAREPRAGHFWPNEEPGLLAAIKAVNH